ncbi:MAG TPA: GNAT family N-acetyltransferase [Solirubrobacterales bacterium]|jgi:GNAT superfamily N-acetyltransferase
MATVRPARPDEADAVLPLYEWLFAPPGSKPALWDEVRARAALAATIAGDDSDVLVADEADELIGFCTAYLDMHSVRFGPRVWIEDLAVHPDHRSRGIGKALLDAAKDWARARGATHLELDSSFARQDAHRFYERERPSWSSRSFGWQL